MRRFRDPSKPVAVAVAPSVVVGLAIVTVGAVIYPVPPASKTLLTVRVLVVLAVVPPPPLKVIVGPVV
jgi:hypothetical protein